MPKGVIPPALLALAGGCAEPPDRRARPPAEDFRFDQSVRITMPSNGDAVDSRFPVAVETGPAVASVALLLDGANIGDIDPESGPVALQADAGRHRLVARGRGPGGAVVSEHGVTFQVTVDDTPWIGITSPSDGATVPNPVRFSVSASPTIDAVELLADGWPLGTITPTEVLSYRFTGTGFERTIEARALEDGVVVAADTIALSVAPGSTPSESVFNDHVVALMAAYPTDGSYPYWWPSDGDWAGNPHDIWYRGALFAAGDVENRSFCVGLTFEVFMRAFDEVDRDWGGDGILNGVSFDALHDFRTDWFVRELYGTGVVEAVENHGIGEAVTDWSDVRPGDFVQFWRHSGSGHNVVFLDWERDGTDTIIGFRYWSTQDSTAGIGENAEYFGSSGSNVDPNHFHVARIAEPDQWQPWR